MDPWLPDSLIAKLAVIFAVLAFPAFCCLCLELLLTQGEWVEFLREVFKSVLQKKWRQVATGKTFWYLTHSSLCWLHIEQCLNLACESHFQNWHLVFRNHDVQCRNLWCTRVEKPSNKHDPEEVHEPVPYCKDLEANYHSTQTQDNEHKCLRLACGASLHSLRECTTQ